MQEPSTWFGKGMLLINKGLYDQAEYQFRAFLERYPDFVPALIGRAALHYYQKQYKEALAFFQKALRLDPNGKPDIRIGVGLCFAQLDLLEQAKYAIERALERDPSNLVCLCLLANVYFNLAKPNSTSPESREFVRMGVSLIKQAQSIDSRHPLVQTALAEVMFHKGEYQKSLKLAQQSFTRTGDQYVQALLSYYIGRIFHVQDNYIEALQHYNRALQLDSSNPLVQYGLAQAQIGQNDASSAIENLEALLKKDEKNLDVARVLAFLYAQDPEKEEKAVDLFRQVCQTDNDTDTWTEYARLLETRDLTAAVEAYQTLNKQMVEKGDFSLSMLNNLAAVLHSATDYDGAEKTYLKALEICNVQMKAEEDESSLNEIRATVMYNLARLYEERYPDDLDKAMKLYRDILELFPQYIDAILRLGCIAQSKGSLSEASELFKDALGFESNNVSGWILTANLNLAKKVHKMARVAFDRILKQVDHKETYALVALGNDKLQVLHSETKPENKQTISEDAVKLFADALKWDNKNVYAANGLAIAMAETGYLVEAKDAFSQIREAYPTLTSAQVNLAHVWVELGQYHSAIALYESTNKKFFEQRDVQLILFTARAYYIMARVEKKSDYMSKCIKCLQKAYHYVPRDVYICFNLALAMQQYAQLVCDKPEDQRTVTELKKAQEFVNVAESLFHQLTTHATKFGKDQSNNRLGYDPQLAGQREKHCQSVRSLVSRRLTQQQANEMLQQEKLYELKRKRDLEETQRKEKAKEEKRRRMEAEAQLRAERQQIIDKLLEEKREEIVVTKVSKKRGRDKEDFVVDDDAAIGTEASSKKKRTTGEKKERKASRRGSSRKETKDDEEGGKNELSAEIVHTSDEESDQDNSKSGASTPKEKPKKRLVQRGRPSLALSEEFVKSDDDDEEGEAEASADTQRPLQSLVIQEDDEDEEQES